jgi:DNA-binding transcriptional ArsR family regulator
MDETSGRTVRRLDARSLRALAHPLRVRILELLHDGPATATTLGDLLGESSGTTSWHLRQLAEHGLIVEDAKRGNRRERWWKLGQDRTQLRTVDFAGDPQTKGAMDIVLYEMAASGYQRVGNWIAEAADWPDDWQRAWDMSDFDLRLTPVELRELTKEVHAIVERYRRADRPGDETVLVQMQMFPRRGTTRPS